MHLALPTNMTPGIRSPSIPDGYADPAQDPLYPQQFAEIMGGRIALSQTESDTPRSLELAVIGDKSAAEIRWLR